MEYGKDYYGFVYVWYNRVALETERRDHEKDKGNITINSKKKHPRLYIGSHMGSTDDGYICSSDWMKASYKRNPQNFMRRIIYWQKTKNKKELKENEQKWLDLISKEELGTRFYNLIRNQGNYKKISKTTKQKISETLKAKYASGERVSAVKGKPMSDEHKQKISIANTGKTSWKRDKKTPQKTKEKISQSNSRTWKNKYQEGYIHPMEGKHHSFESNEKNRLAHLGIKMTLESSKKKRQAMTLFWQNKKAA